MGTPGQKQLCFRSRAQCHLEVGRFLLPPPTQPQTPRCTLAPMQGTASHFVGGWLCAPGVQVKI